jgi:hypothetical protein
VACPAFFYIDGVGIANVTVSSKKTDRNSLFWLNNPILRIQEYGLYAFGVIRNTDDRIFE